MLRTTLCLLAAWLSLAAANAQPGYVARIEILEAGIFTVESLGEMRLVEATTNVPARVGVTFGVRYRIVGAEPGTPVALKFITRFPAQGLHNPARNETQFRDEVV